MTHTMEAITSSLITLDMGVIIILQDTSSIVIGIVDE